MKGKGGNPPYGPFPKVIIQISGVSNVLHLRVCYELSICFDDSVDRAVHQHHADHELECLSSVLIFFSFGGFIFAATLIAITAAYNFVVLEDLSLEVSQTFCHVRCQAK